MRDQATAVRAPRGVDGRQTLRADALHRREHALLIEAVSLIQDAWERVHEADAVRSRRALGMPDDPSTVLGNTRADAFADAVAALAGRAARLDRTLRQHALPPDIHVPRAS